MLYEAMISEMKVVTRVDKSSVNCSEKRSLRGMSRPWVATKCSIMLFTIKSKKNLQTNCIHNYYSYSYSYHFYTFRLGELSCMDKKRTGEIFLKRWAIGNITMNKSRTWKTNIKPIEVVENYVLSGPLHLFGYLN